MKQIIIFVLICLAGGFSFEGGRWLFIEFRYLFKKRKAMKFIKTKKSGLFTFLCPHCAHVEEKNRVVGEFEILKCQMCTNKYIAGENRYEPGEENGN